MHHPFRRLPLTGLGNARDLGGHPAAGGRATNFGRFIRSEVPRALTEADLCYLRDLGVTTSIDFRGDVEVARTPSVFAGAEGFSYHRSPTFNAQVAFAAREKARNGGPPIRSFVRWGEKYIEMAEGCQDWVKSTLALMAAAPGGVIYNCTTGKDRTGMISALLLGLAGVDDLDIIADYAISQIYLTELYGELLDEYNSRFPDQRAALGDPFFRTDPENMTELLAHFRDAYGGIPGYVAACGVSEAVCAALRGRLRGA